MPAGTAAAKRQFDGGDGTGPGPIPPHVTTYSVAAHLSSQVQPVRGPQLGHSIAPSVVQLQPEPSDNVQDTNVRFASQVVRELVNDDGHEQAEAASLDNEASEVASSAEESVTPPPPSALVEVWPATPPGPVTPPQPSEQYAHATASQDPIRNASMRPRLTCLMEYYDAAFQAAIPAELSNALAASDLVTRYAAAGRRSISHPA
jgi:hypothetical protein